MNCEYVWWSHFHWFYFQESIIPPFKSYLFRRPWTLSCLVNLPIINLLSSHKKLPYFFEVVFNELIQEFWKTFFFCKFIFNEFIKEALYIFFLGELISIEFIQESLNAFFLVESSSINFFQGSLNAFLFDEVISNEFFSGDLEPHLVEIFSMNNFQDTLNSENVWWSHLNWIYSGVLEQWPRLVE